jgi:outer membrane protein OmpA-like peptidoglycan-associated protein
MRKAIASTLFTAAVATAATGCTHPHTKTFVKVDDVALGRVVVYRNGVAYYERNAVVTGGKLQVKVPRDRVDDFLKSLTVVDRKTKQAVPVSFPRQGGEEDQGDTVTMSLELPQGAPSDLVLTYVTEAPAWKPSYRIVVGDNGKVMLEGWAIVDNTSGEDWKNVLVGVGSSSAMSFHFDLWSVRQVQRETLHADESFAVAPPTAVSPYSTTTGTADGTEIAQLDDDEIRRPAGHPDAPPPPSAAPAAEAEYYGGDADMSEDSGGGGGGAGRGARAPRPHRDVKAKAPTVATVIAPVDTRARPAQTRVTQGDQKVHALAEQLNRNGQTLVIEGYADGNRAGAEQRALDRANLVRNELIDQGVAPAQVKVIAKAVPGERDRVRLVQEAAPVGDKDKAIVNGQPTTDEAPVGESHFANERPMTVGKGTSVMVSMVRDETEGEVVYLYDAESERGNKRFAFKAVRLKNPTDSSLETGPVTVYGDGRFIGEGLTEPIPPNAEVVVPFALDRQIIVDKDESQDNEVARLVTLERGILTAEVQHIRREKFTFSSRLNKPTTVYIRHTTAKGWKMIEGPKVYERIGDASLFAVTLAAGESKTVEVAEATPMTRTLDLSSDVALDMLKVYVQSPEPTEALKKDLNEVLGIHREMIDLQTEIDSLHTRMGDYRERMDELHAQILTLTAVKSGGELMTHLKQKMKEISEKVQKSTIDVVDTEEKLMLARVRFQDALAELHLPDVTGGPGPSTPSAPGGAAAIK